jgi:hypothetical protein
MAQNLYQILEVDQTASQEQIKKAYYDLTADFAQRPFEEVMAKLKDKLQAGAKPKAKGEKFGSGMAKGDLKLKLWPDRGAKEHETPPKEIDEATTNLRSRKAKRYKKKQED